MGRFKGQDGQFAIEAILLMTVLVIFFVGVTNYLKENKTISGFVTGPWSKVAGMTETGTWADPEDSARKSHPNNFNRFYTPTE